MESKVDDRARVSAWLCFRFDENDAIEWVEFVDSFRIIGGRPEKPTDERVGDGIEE